MSSKRRTSFLTMLLSLIMAGTLSLGLSAGTASATPTEASVIELTPADVSLLNEAADITGEPRLPAGTAGLAVDGDSVAPVDEAGNVLPVIQPRSIGGTAWKYTKCAAAVAAAFIPAGKAYTAIKGLGGVAQAARLLIGAGNRSDFLKIGGNAALEILGIAGIEANCF